MNNLQKLNLIKKAEEITPFTFTDPTTGKPFEAAPPAGSSTQEIKPFDFSSVGRPGPTRERELIDIGGGLKWDQINQRVIGGNQSPSEIVAPSKTPILDAVRAKAVELDSIEGKIDPNRDMNKFIESLPTMADLDGTNDAKFQAALESVAPPPSTKSDEELLADLQKELGGSSVAQDSDLVEKTPAVSNKPKPAVKDLVDKKPARPNIYKDNPETYSDEALSKQEHTAPTTKGDTGGEVSTAGPTSGILKKLLGSIKSNPGLWAGGAAGVAGLGLGGYLYNRYKKKQEEEEEEKEATFKSAKGRCWTGYEPVPGKEPYSDGSCRPVGSKKKKKDKKKQVKSSNLQNKLDRIQFTYIQPKQASFEYLPTDSFVNLLNTK